MPQAAGPGATVVCPCGEPSPSTARFCASCGRSLSDGSAARRDHDVVETLRGVAPRLAERLAADGDALPEERRVVTALFADLSGFTTLAGSLEPEELLAVVDPVIEGLGEIVDRYGGYVEKFAGDAVLALFGAPVAHEDDAARALSAAIDMHRELPHFSSHPRAAGLALHIGVTTGAVVARTVGSSARLDYAVLGEAVVLAQRLESLAPPGEVYVGAPTRMLVGSAFTFDELGAVPVRGRRDPLVTFRLIGPAAPGRRSDVGPLVGRDAERAQLLVTLAGVRQGASPVVRVAGPAGSGKSRLLDELRSAASASGIRVVELDGASHVQSPYRCLVPLLEAALVERYPHARDLADRLDRLAHDERAPVSPALTRVLAGVADDEHLGARAPDAVRRQLRDAAMTWVRELARHGPLVLTADGLHWFDPASREVLDDVAEDPPPATLLCLSGRELDAPDAGGPAEVHVRLGALSWSAVRELVGAELDLVPDDHLVDYVAGRGQGNPLLTRETVRQLHQEGLLDAQHGHARLRAGGGTASVPESLEGILGARLDTLTAASLRVATAAAVAGFVTPVRLLTDVTRMADAPLRRGLDELVDAGVVVVEPADGSEPSPEDLVRFESSLVRDTVYARLTTRRRRELHTRVADALETADDATDEGVALLADHRFLSGDHAAALPWLRRAAGWARRLLAQDIAADTLTRAVAAARSAAPDELVDLLGELAEVRAERGEFDRAAELYDEARLVGNGAAAWAGGAAVLRRQGRYRAALALLAEAERARPAGDLRLVALERGWTLSVSGDLQGCLEASWAGLGLGDPDDRVAGLLLLQVVRAETLLGDLGAAREHADRAIHLLRRTGDLSGLCTAYRLLGSLQQSAGELDAAARTLEEGLTMARRTGLVEEIGGCQINLGLVHADRGDHQAAEACYREAATTFEQAGFEAGRAIAYGNRSCELVALGRHAEARELGRTALALAEEIGNQLTAADIHQTLALAAEALGDAETAAHEAAAAVAGFVRAGVPAAARESRELLLRATATDADLVSTEPG